MTIFSYSSRSPFPSAVGLPLQHSMYNPNPNQPLRKLASQFSLSLSLLIAPVLTLSLSRRKTSPDRPRIHRASSLEKTIEKATATCDSVGRRFSSSAISFLFFLIVDFCLAQSDRFYDTRFESRGRRTRKKNRGIFVCLPQESTPIAVATFQIRPRIETEEKGTDDTRRLLIHSLLRTH